MAFSTPWVKCKMHQPQQQMGLRSAVMSADVASGKHSGADTDRESTPDDGTADVRVAAELVAEAGQMLDTLTRLAAQQSEKLSAAERLLAELDDARGEHEDRMRIARPRAPDDS